MHYYALFLCRVFIFRFLCDIFCLAMKQCLNKSVLSLRKGTVLQPGEVRTIITEYVKANELVDENNKK